MCMWCICMCAFVCMCAWSVSVRVCDCAKPALPLRHHMRVLPEKLKEIQATGIGNNYQRDCITILIQDACTHTRTHTHSVLGFVRKCSISRKSWRRKRNNTSSLLPPCSHHTSTILILTPSHSHTRLSECSPDP